MKISLEYVRGHNNPKFEVNIQESWFIRYNKEGLVYFHIIIMAVVGAVYTIYK